MEITPLLQTWSLPSLTLALSLKESRKGLTRDEGISGNLAGRMKAGEEPKLDKKLLEQRTEPLPGKTVEYGKRAIPGPSVHWEMKT